MLKVLTYNIHKGFDRYNRNFILHNIRNQLESIDVDVVFLQEVLGQHLHHEVSIPRWPDVSQFEYLADQLWPHYAYGKNAIYSKGHHGNAILCKHAFGAWENVNLSRFQKASRSLLHGVITLPEQSETVHLICVHLELVGFERNRQIKILKQYIQNAIPNDEPVILAGDFNDWSGRAGGRIESALGVQEVFRSSHGEYAKTFPSHWPVLRMDRIYYRGATLVGCERLCGRPWKKLSDHLPLYASFAA